MVKKMIEEVLKEPVDDATLQGIMEKYGGQGPLGVVIRGLEKDQYMKLESDLRQHAASVAHKNHTVRACFPRVRASSDSFLQRR